MRLFLLGIIMMCVSVHAVAQSPVARFMFEDAEKAYAAGNYGKALSVLADAEKELGRVNPPILHLRIKVRWALIESQGDYADFAQVSSARADVDEYFKKYGAEQALEDQAREVYEVFNKLKSLPSSEAEFAAILAEKKRVADEDLRIAQEEASALTVRRERQAAFESRQYKLGETGPAGGMIFYDKGQFSNGWRYLEVAPADWVRLEKKFGLIFGCQGVDFKTTKNDGEANTKNITSSCSRSPANMIDAYSVTKDGVVYDDWFLPSWDDLSKFLDLPLYGVKTAGIDKGYPYWTSTQPLDESTNAAITTHMLCMEYSWGSSSTVPCARDSAALARPVRKVKFK